MQRFAAAASVLAFGSFLLSSTPSNSNDRRVQLTPHFVQGATLRYRIDTNTDSNLHTTTPIIDSQGGSQFRQAIGFVVRLDVLGVRPAEKAEEVSGAVHFRATFEESHSDSTTDAATPAQMSLDDEIDKLAGHSFEFTLSPGAEPSDVKGLDEITTNPAVAQSALAWIPVLANIGSFPPGGIEIGQKWNSEHPVSGFPLTGMAWRSDSTYLRDDPCGSSAPASNDPHAATAGQETCAVILTRFDMSRHGSEHSDATPDDYRRNGLRTSGKWTVSGESLNSVSLADGFLVSSTQTATQDMDYEIVSATSGSRIHQAGHTTTQTEITLDREPAPPPSH